VATSGFLAAVFDYQDLGLPRFGAGAAAALYDSFFLPISWAGWARVFQAPRTWLEPIILLAARFQF
jgi:hypothetical protein